MTPQWTDPRVSKPPDRPAAVTPHELDDLTEPERTAAPGHAFDVIAEMNKWPPSPWLLGGPTDHRSIVQWDGTWEAEDRSGAPANIDPTEDYGRTFAIMVARLVHTAPRMAKSLLTATHAIASRDAELEAARARIRGLEASVDRMRGVVEAATAWRLNHGWAGPTADDFSTYEQQIIAAVDALAAKEAT